MLMGRLTALFATVALLAATAPAGAQCCGDCNGNGQVGIEELVGAVGNALGSCPAGTPLVTLRDAELSYLRVTLHADVDGGSIGFTAAINWSGADPSDRALFSIQRPNTWPDQIQLVKSGSHLRWVVTDAGGLEHDLSVSIDDWHPGQTHSVLATWGGGRTTLTLDGMPAGEQSLGDVRFTAGDALQVGAPQEPGTVFQQLEILSR
jgi:hypothetical protein